MVLSCSRALLVVALLLLSSCATAQPPAAPQPRPVVYYQTVPMWEAPRYSCRQICVGAVPCRMDCRPRYW
jgi:hypothetical protein